MANTTTPDHGAITVEDNTPSGLTQGGKRASNIRAVLGALIEQVEQLMQMPEVFSGAEKEIIRAGFRTMIDGFRRKADQFELERSQPNEAAQ